MRSKVTAVTGGTVNLHFRVRCATTGLNTPSLAILAGCSGRELKHGLPSPTTRRCDIRPSIGRSGLVLPCLALVGQPELVTKKLAAEIDR